MSLGERVAFAPGATEIWFSPSMPTAMSATPVGRVGRDDHVIGPDVVRAERLQRGPPSWSSPTEPSIQTPGRVDPRARTAPPEAIARAAATA